MNEPDSEVDRLAHAVIGAAIEVHRHLGPGYLESIYEEAMAVELSLRSISFDRQHVTVVQYKGKPIGESHLDFLVANSLVVELKAVAELAPIHAAQVISYLKAMECQLGLLINFNVSTLKDGVRRIILTPGTRD